MTPTVPHAPVALTIAGSDSSGGAGIQADLKTFAALGVYGASAITALTAQNTTGVTGIHVVPPDVVRAQIEAVLDDLDVGAIKIGMVPARATMEAIADALARRPQANIVLDPVMVATSGARLMQADAVEALRVRLIPQAVLLTPNLPEAAALTGGAPAGGEAEMARQGEALLRLGARAVLVKGGHSGGETSVDILVDAQGVTRFSAPRIATRNTHGTGCTLSAAIAACLAKGADLREAVAMAKRYLTAALMAADRLAVGKGKGPLHHFHGEELGRGGAP